ncbi:MAG: DUF1501 domain-containing protein, partial [Myxococcota bacterium]
NVLLRSLATGIPASVLLRPLSAGAGGPGDGRMLILSSDERGGPLNCNAPGTYDAAPTEIFHPQDASMAPTPLTLGGQPFVAAKPWADLPQSLLDQTCFFHHATYTPVHGEHSRVMKMMGATEKSDMLVSLLARETAEQLGTVQSEPLSLGARGPELLSSAGRLLGNVPPTSVAQALGGVEGPLAELRGLRDASVDRVYNLYKERGTPAQRDLLDAWVRTRDDARSVSDSLLSRLAGITDDGEAMQVRTAAVLAAMNIAPVITVHLDFGGDTHTDPGLATETARYPVAVSNIALLMAELAALQAEGNLPHEVVFGTLNVFGRTHKKQGYAGRDHHDGHHTMLLMGPGIAPGVIGGIAPNRDGSEYISQPIDSVTGAADIDGDVPFEETLGAAGKTLGRALGVDEARLDEIVTPGKIVQAALA